MPLDACNEGRLAAGVRLEHSVRGIAQVEDCNVYGGCERGYLSSQTETLAQVGLGAMGSPFSDNIA